MELTINLQIKSDLLVSAFVSLIDYADLTWVESISVPDHVSAHYDRWYANPAFWESNYEITVIHDGPNYPHEGSIDCTTIITPERLKTGLELMAIEDPKEFANLITEDGSTSTTDLMLQYIVLGAAVFI